VRSTDLHAIDSKKIINFIHGACEKDFFTAPLNFNLKLHQSIIVTVGYFEIQKGIS